MDLDDEFALWEERDLLLARLIECKTFKDVAQIFHAARRRGRPVVPAHGRSRRAVRRHDAGPARGHELAPVPERCDPGPHPAPVPIVDLFHVDPIKITVAEAVAELIDELPRVGRISFRRLTADLADRIEVIVRFLAVLELFKQGYVELDQPQRFGDIEITWCAAADVSTPSRS